MNPQTASLIVALAVPCLILVALLRRRWTAVLHRVFDREPPAVTPGLLIATHVYLWRRAVALREAQLRYDLARDFRTARGFHLDDDARAARIRRGLSGRSA